jgi:signal transduction histidine kinase
MSNPIHILYIEDNYDNQRLVRRTLATRGYQIEIAPDGAVGLELAQQKAPDLILMDINLPGLNGYELTTKFKAIPTLSAVPIIALTANTMPGDRERALAAGCDGYISKPIDPRALPEQVASYVGGTREELPVAEAPTFMREYSQQLVTRLENHVRDLEAANDRLVKLDQAKNEFLATISHELRTPLTVIHGYTDLLNMQALGPLNDGQREAMELIRRNSYRLLRHINDLIYLQQVRSSELDLQQLDLRTLVTSICNDMQKQITAKQQTLNRRLGPNGDTTPLTIQVDTLGFENAMRHLIENAMLYTQDGGEINVIIQPSPNDIAVVIRDNGIGIDESNHERIFESFVRLDETLASVGGAGLGLVIARHVAEAHGGTLTVESALGQGSTFTFRIPRQQA